jgi:alkanesulfonate monooxygenase SsuD/methylene tetrahydromethanopterin reductase-like flavin-dependent oxidoreductase (luciferase family)
LGALVTPVARRRPWKLAKEITTLDHLSGGRVIVGVGLGTPADLEYEAFGEPGDARTHAARLDEALPLLDAFLRGERVDHGGAHYQVHAHLNPSAQQRPRPPIWVAATLPHKRPVARAARWDGIFPLDTRGEEFVSPDAMAELVASMDIRPGYDVVAMGNPSGPVEQFEQAGATWMIDGPSSPRESFEQIRKIIRAGVPR